MKRILAGIVVGVVLSIGAVGAVYVFHWRKQPEQVHRDRVESEKRSRVILARAEETVDNEIKAIDAVTDAAIRAAHYDTWLRGIVDRARRERRGENH